MTKQIWRCLWVGLCSLFLAGVSFGQDKIPFFVSGKKQGMLPAIVQNNTTYLDIQKTARKLGADVAFFARSKQAKITARGFYAILTAELDEVVLNAQAVRLSAPVLVKGGEMLAPVDFFLLPQISQALGKEISFSQGALQVERPFGLERLENVFSADEGRLIFRPRHAVTWSSITPNSHSVEVTFSNVTIKRDESFRFKTGFISSVKIYQERNNAVLRVMLGKKARQWKVEEQHGKIYFRAGTKLAPLAPAIQPPPAKIAVTEKQPVLQQPSMLTEESSTEELSPASKEVVVAPVEVTVKPAPELTVKPAPAPVITTARKKMRIVVDPGHGGKDPGAVRSRTREKDLNLAVSKELYKLLKKGGFEVSITRGEDVFIPLYDRSKLSNKFKADLFVSVHTNSSKNRNANGFEVYFRSEKATDKEAAETAALENEAMQYEEVHYNFVDALLQSLAKNEYINESSKLAGYVRNAVYKQPGIGIGVNQNNSVRQANFYVLKGVQSPAILIEMGYISNQKDRGRLTQSGVQKKMAQGIYNGIYNYAKQEGWIN
ncbi:MAG: N-acetylmuramoyl-L-alanine amidase [Elusimicrobiaceae bacterium]|nr:N-acetylmuramoyl-L-alanine amidase [Elusimicrobiaceae bacterium]